MLVNLNCLNTLFEKIIVLQLKRFLVDNDIICPQQHGFVPARSTVSAILTLSHNIITALHNGEIATAVFLDIKKAFDTVPHDILLQKLESYGFSDSSLQFFSSYLSSRKQKVVINNNESAYSTIVCGVPQGSVLGPVLFFSVHK